MHFFLFIASCHKYSLTPNLSHIQENIFVPQSKWTNKNKIQPFGTEIFMSYSGNNETESTQLS